MVKVCINFKNILFVWVYLKEVCFVGIVFTWFLFCNVLAALHLQYFLNFSSKSIFSLMKYCISFVLETYTFFQNIKLFLIKTIIFSIKQFNISIGYNLNFLSNNVNRLNPSKKWIKMFEYFSEKITNNGILLQETHSSHDTVINWHDNFKGELISFTWNHKFMWCHDCIFR